MQEDGKLIGVVAIVARLDILRQKLNEGFVTIDGEVGLLKLRNAATAVCYLFQIKATKSQF